MHTYFRACWLTLREPREILHIHKSADSWIYQKKMDHLIIANVKCWKKQEMT